MTDTKTQTTKEIILAYALKEFNERGLEQVGIREIAKKLNLSPGNISYYFPKKEDLLAALINQLHEVNSVHFSHFIDEDLSFEKLCSLLRTVMENQVKYRFIYLSIVWLYNNNPALRSYYDQVFQRRINNLSGMIDRLIANGLLVPQLPERERKRLIAHWTLVSRFSYSEAQVSLRNFSQAEIIDHYLEMLLSLFLPYATAGGRVELEEVINKMKPASYEL